MREGVREDVGEDVGEGMREGMREDMGDTQGKKGCHWGVLQLVGKGNRLTNPGGERQTQSGVFTIAVT